MMDEENLENRHQPRKKTMCNSHRSQHYKVDYRKLSVSSVLKVLQLINSQNQFNLPTPVEDWFAIMKNV